VFAVLLPDLSTLPFYSSTKLCISRVIFLFSLCVRRDFIHRDTTCFSVIWTILSLRVRRNGAIPTSSPKSAMCPLRINGLKLWLLGNTLGNFFTAVSLRMHISGYWWVFCWNSDTTIRLRVLEFLTYTESGKDATMSPLTCQMPTGFGATVCKTVRPMLSDPCLSVLSVLSCLWCWCIVAKWLDGSRWNLACR